MLIYSMVQHKQIFLSSAAVLMMGKKMKTRTPCPLAPSQPLEYPEIVATTLL